MNKKQLQEKKFKKLMEMKALLEARNAALKEKKANKPGSGLARLLEGELERAQLTLSAQDVVNKLQDIAEDLAEMSVQQLLPLVDEMKGEFGPEAAQMFEDSVGTALDNALQATRDAREQVNNAVLKMQGKLSDEDVSIPDNDMADSTGDDLDLGAPEEMGDDLGLELGSTDEFGGAPAASGEEGNPLGRAKKESIQYSKKKSKIVESRHEAALLEAFAELAGSGDLNSLTLELVADKFGVCEEELLELYNSANILLTEVRNSSGGQGKNRLDEFLPLLAPLAGVAARAAGGAALKGLGGLGSAALKKLGSAALKKGGAAAMNKLGSMFGGDDSDMTPADQARQEQKLKVNSRTDPDMRKLAATFGVQPHDIAKLRAAMASEGRFLTKKALKEHRIIEDIVGVTGDDAIKLIRERIKAVKTGKDLAVRETFPADVQLTTPRAVAKQLMIKYGEPSGWSVAQSDEGSYYVLSSPIPESEKVKSLQGEIQGLEEEITSIRDKHADVQAEYQLPQEIKIGQLRQRLGEYETGYRHQVAKWLTFEEASALISLAQSCAPKKKGK